MTQQVLYNAGYGVPFEEYALNEYVELTVARHGYNTLFEATRSDGKNKVVIHASRYVGYDWGNNSSVPWTRPKAWKTLWAGQQQVNRSLNGTYPAQTLPVDLDYGGRYKITWGWWGRCRSFEPFSVETADAIGGLDTLGQWVDPYLGSIYIYKSPSTSNVAKMTGGRHRLSATGSAEWAQDDGMRIYRIEKEIYI